MSARYAEKFEQAYDAHGIRAGVEYLEGIKADLDSLRSDVDNMLTTAREVAVKQGAAAYVLDDPKELAPTKDQFIKLYGRATFDRVKRISKPKRIFTWLTK
jgi:hypothetical protein